MHTNPSTFYDGYAHRQIHSLDSREVSHSQDRETYSVEPTSVILSQSAQVSGRKIDAMLHVHCLLW